MSDSRDSEPAPDDLGRTVGGYRLVRRLGQGGMGAVYLGAHPTLPRKVAVKVILPELAASAEMRRRFLDEARLVASLHHPSLVEVLDLAELDDGRLYIVMEYLEGEALSTMVERRGTLPVGEAAAIAVETLRGLAAAHAGGVLHRDIKPHNLYVVRDGEGGRVKVLDFGLAKVHASAGPGVTRTGAILGTPGYMAPEQAAGTREVDARADVYAVGVVLYEMLAGKPPFYSDDWVELLHMHRTMAVPRIEGVPAALAAVVNRALAKKVDDRFASAAEMATEIERAVGSEMAMVPAPEIRAIAAAAADADAGDGKRVPGDGAQKTVAGKRRSDDAKPATEDGAKGAVTRALKRSPSPSPGADAPMPPTRIAKPARVGISVALVGAAIAATAAVALWPRGGDRTAVAAAVVDAAAETALESKVDASSETAAGASPPPADAGAVSVPPATDAGIRPTTDARAPSPDLRSPPPDARAPSPDARAPTPSPDAATTALTVAPELPGGHILIDDIPTPKAWDYHARIGHVRDLAHRVLPDARLVHISASGILANGTLDLTNRGVVTYTFRSPSLSDRGSRPRGSTWTCLVMVTVRDTFIQIVTYHSTCDEPFITPRCDGRELWAIAASRGAETDRLADLFYYPDGGKVVWKLRPDESYEIDDSECPR